MKNIFIVLILAGLFLTGCGKQTDYGEYIFTDVIWTRDGGHDRETIIFHADGSFSYSCACGNPINDSDLCESYTYNDKTKEIRFKCIETTEDLITNIKIVEMSEDILELDFGGEIRKFEKESQIKE